MKDDLIWGDPPEDAPEAGKLVPPKVLENAPGSEVAGNIDLFDKFGMKLPEWARIRYVLRKTRKFDKPFKVDCGDLGRLSVGDDGWRLERR